MCRSRLSLAALALNVLLLSPTASATDWTNPGTGSWSDAANWNGGVPVSVFFNWMNGTDGVISNGGTAQVTGSSAARGALVGYGGTGSLQILAGGSLTTYLNTVGNAPVFDTPEGTGTVDVWGTWQNSNFIQIGQGTINIHAGGRIQWGTILVGSDEDYDGTLNVSGFINPSMAGTVYMSIGAQGNGRLNLESGGSISGTAVLVGASATGRGIAQVDGGTWAANSMSIGASGHGEVNLVGGTITVGGGAGMLNLGVNAGSTGILHLGTGSTIGTLAAAEIHGGLGSAELRLNHNVAGGHTLNTLLSGSLAVRHIAGTTTISGANAHTGATIVEGGVLILSDAGNGVSALGTGDLAVEADGTFQGVGTVLGDALVSGTLRPGNSPGELEFAGDLTLTNSAVVHVELASLTLHDKIIVGGVMTYDGLMSIDLLDDYFPAEGAQFHLFQAGDYTPGSSFSSITINNHEDLYGIMDYESGILTLTSIPEPSTTALALLTLLLLFPRLMGRGPS